MASNSEVRLKPDPKGAVDRRRFARDGRRARIPDPRGEGARRDRPHAGRRRLGRAGRARRQPLRRAGVAVREFVMKPPHGRADYLLFVDGAAAGVIEAKKEGETLRGVQWQSAKYVDGVPDEVPTALEGALPFVYESTGTRPASRTRSTRMPRAARSSRSTGRETLAALARRDPQATRPRRRSAIASHMPPLEPRRPLAAAGHRDPQPRAVARREPAARADPDGDRLGQDASPPRTSPTASSSTPTRAACSSSSTARTSAARRSRSSRGSRRRTTGASSPSSTTSSTSPRTTSTRSRA